MRSSNMFGLLFLLLITVFAKQDDYFDLENYSIPNAYFVSYVKTNVAKIGDETTEKHVRAFELEKDDFIAGSYKAGLSEYTNYYDKARRVILTIEMEDKRCSQENYVDFEIENLNLQLILAIFPLTNSFKEEDLPKEKATKFTAVLLLKYLVEYYFESVINPLTGYHNLKKIVVTFEDKKNIVDVKNWEFVNYAQEYFRFEFPMINYKCYNTIPIELATYPNKPSLVVMKKDKEATTIFSLDPINNVGLKTDDKSKRYNLRDFANGLNYDRLENLSCQKSKLVNPKMTPAQVMKETFAIFGSSENEDFAFSTKTPYKNGWAYVFTSVLYSTFVIDSSVYSNVVVHRYYENRTDLYPFMILVADTTSKKNFVYNFEISELQNDYREVWNKIYADCNNDDERIRLGVRFAVNQTMAAALKSSRELMVKFEDQLRIKVLNNNYNPLRFSAYIIVPEKDHISISFDLQERRPIEDYFNVIEKKSLKVGLQTGIKDKQECIKHCYESTECLGWSFSDELCLFSKNLILDSDMRNDQNGTVGSRLVSTKYSELSNEKVAKNLENAISQGDFNLMIPFGKQVVPITATNLIEITVNGKLSIKREIEEKYTDIGNGYFEDVQYVAGVNTLSECYKLAESVQDPDVRGFQFEPDTKDCNLGLFRVVIGNEENRKNLTFKYMVDSMKLFESDDVPYYINKELKAFKSLRLTHTKDVESVKECLDECLFNSKSICRSLYFSPNEKECYMNQDYQWLPFNNVEKTSDTELTYRYRISTKPSFTRSDFILKFKESDIREMHEASTKTVASDCLENERCHGYLLCFKDSEDFIPTRAFVYERDNMTLSVASDYDLNILCSDNKRKENEYHLVRYTEEERVQIGGFAIFACCLLFLGSGFLIFGYLHLKNLYEYLKLRRK